MIKKILFVIIILCFTASITSNAKTRTISSREKCFKEITKQWEDNYFEKIVISKGKARIDGKKGHLSDILGISKKEEKKILSSDTYAKKYFSNDKKYKVVKEKKKLIITQPYQTKRIIVKGYPKKTYNATFLYHDKEYDQTILQYQTDEEAKKACKKLHGIPDLIVSCYSANNPKGKQSWGLDAMGFNNQKENIPEEYKTHRIKVAVIDTGYNPSSYLVNGRNFLPESKSFSNDNEGMQDNVGHGSHVTGIIVENTPDNVDMMEYKIAQENGETSLYLISEALKDAINNDADVINISLGFEDPEFADLYNPIDEILKIAYNYGTVVVVAAGNDSTHVSSSYPACNSKVITVSSLSPNDKVSDFSNFGDKIDFCAPGEDIWSCGQYGKYSLSLLSGTSMAAPHITAAVAYIKMKYPNAKSKKVYNELKKLCKDYGSEGKDSLYGWGVPVFDNYFNVPMEEDKSSNEKPGDVRITGIEQLSGGYVKINWTKSYDDCQYVVNLKSENTPYTEIAKVENVNSYTIKIPSECDFYFCMIEVYRNDLYSDSSNEVKFIYMTPPKLKIKKQNTKLLVLSSDIMTDNVEQEVQVSKSKKFRKSKKFLIKKNKNKLKIKKLKKGKYYIRARCVKKSNNLTYKSTWSKNLKVKVK